MEDRRAVMGRRLRTMFDLHRFGVRMMRQNLRRRHPEAPDEEIDRMLAGWLREKRGREHDGGVGEAEAAGE